MTMRDKVKAFVEKHFTVEFVALDSRGYNVDVTMRGESWEGVPLLTMTRREIAQEISKALALEFGQPMRVVVVTINDDGFITDRVADNGTYLSCHTFTLPTGVNVIKIDRSPSDGHCDGALWHIEALLYARSLVAKDDKTVIVVATGGNGPMVLLQGCELRLSQRHSFNLYETIIQIHRLLQLAT